uniref:Sodium channel toxin NaTx9 n=1 Tax=Odontobuthus doriae TaxID=342590 RepID=A0A0U4PXU5_ODODO|nr:sodium channel toxin NaTx9 [Odontobuthus doriae]
MKLLLLLIISASMLIEELVSADGFIKDSDGCKISCPTYGYCDDYCKARGGTKGTCYLFLKGCWCIGLPDDKAWKEETESPSCGRKK